MRHINDTELLNFREGSIVTVVGQYGEEGIFDEFEAYIYYDPLKAIMMIELQPCHIRNPYLPSIHKRFFRQDLRVLNNKYIYYLHM